MKYVVEDITDIFFLIDFKQIYFYSKIYFSKMLLGTWAYPSEKMSAPDSVFHALSNDVIFIVSA
jgi:hypothetical protein